MVLNKVISKYYAFILLLKRDIYASPNFNKLVRYIKQYMIYILPMFI